MTTCDICEKEFALNDLYNVEYGNGLGNVSCETCLDTLDGVVYAWRHIDGVIEYKIDSEVN